MHVECMRAICNEKGSSLQGLEYDGGPEHDCECKEESVIIPYVKFPEDKSTQEVQNWKCDDCLKEFCSGDINLLLDPKVSYRYSGPYR